MLTASGLSKTHGSRTLFDNVTIKVLPGHRTALVGGNGVGKTTLLEILVGIQDPDSGTVTRPRDLRIGYLPQDLEAVAGGTVLAETMSGAAHINEVAAELARLESRLADHEAPDADAVLAAYGEAQSRFEHLGGYALEASAHKILSGLGFRPTDSDRPVRELSGGWRMRVALAKLLLSEPDVLILDEPTNHLDVDSVAWLEQHLAGWTGSLLFVSHDRDFIDGVANRVVEIIGGQATEYVGGFAEFVVAREEVVARAEAAAAQQARKAAHLEQFIERFRYKATKARQVQSRIKTLEKLEAIPVPDRRQLKVRFAFPEPQRSSRVVAEFNDVSVGYDGEVVLEGVDFVVERGRNVALVGPNGAGKTTLIKLITGELEPISGTVTRGANVDVASFAQHQAEVLDESRTVLEEFRARIGDQGSRNLRTVLGSFGFSGDAADRRVGELSGGEQTRLALAMTMANPVNLLILDEPTNHLDLPSCDLLEDALKVYPGTVILVTHDRHLIRGVADALVEVRDGMAVWSEGVDESILTPRGAPPAGSSATATPADGASPPGASPSAEGTDRGSARRRPKKQERRDRARARETRGRATRDVRRSLSRVERDWEQAEALVAELQAELADPATYDDPDRLGELNRRFEEARNRAADLMREWERLTAQLETPNPPSP